MMRAVAGLRAGLVVGVWGTATVLNARHAAAVTSLEHQQTEQTLRNSAAALETYTQLEKQKNDALKAAQAVIDRNRADAVAARAERDRLRADIAGVPARIATASRAAVDEYAAAATVVFEQCTRRYSELAERADGHAANERLIYEAWPR